MPSTKPIRLGAAAAAATLAFTAVGCDDRRDYPKELSPGWIEVDCNPWPGGEGPCYAPPGDADQYDCTQTPCARRTKEAGR